VVTGRVVVVGDLVTDVVTRLHHRLVPGSDTPARIRVTGGGQAANTAAWLAYCRRPVTLVATVGDDPAGRDRVADLAAAGVDCAVRRVPGVPTGTLVVLSGGGDGPDDRTMLTDRGAADRLTPADLDAALDRWPDARHLHLSGYSLLGGGSRAAGRHALAVAAARGLTRSVDAASGYPLRRVGAARFLDWIRGVDLLLANASEAALLAAAAEPPAPDPAPDPAPEPSGRLGSEAATAAQTGTRAATALARVAAIAVVKLGAAGAVWAGPSGVVYGHPAPVTAVDPTGAGDAFAAGLLASWLAGAGPAEALGAGARLGAAAIATLGARPAGAPPAHPW
jgi:sugar/nucleoside kinase (ribokinase family)